jgi:hypothetical protein
MGRIIVIALAMISALPANANPRCDTYGGHNARCQVPLAEAQVSTIDKCCARVAVCAGKIPGCFCASPVAPGARR